MIVKFFPKGKAGLAYLKSKDFCPTIIGDERETQELIAGSRFKNPSTAGVLTFEEHIEDEAKKREICERFTTEVLAPGIDRSAISITWVEHQEPADAEGVNGYRTGLHFVMSNEHLVSGKRMQPYWHKADKQQVKLWQTLINHEYGFSEPDDPEKRQTLSFAHNLPKSVAKARVAITEAIEEQIAGGSVQNYTEVKDFLTETLGLEITREGKRKGVSGVSVRVEGHARPLRLTGGIYEPSFRANYSEGPRPANFREERISKIRAGFDREFKKRVQKNKAKFSPAGRADRITYRLAPGRDQPAPNPEPVGTDRAVDPVIDQPRPYSSPLPTLTLDDDGKSRHGITDRFGGLIARARGAASRIGKIADGLSRSGLRAVRPRRGLEGILASFNKAIGRDLGPTLGDWRGPQPVVSTPAADGRIEVPGLPRHRPQNQEIGGMDP